MKIKYMIITAAISAAAFLVGRNMPEAKYVDTTAVVSYTGSSTGLMLNLADGTGYYLEAPKGK